MRPRTTARTALITAAAAVVSAGFAAAGAGPAYAAAPGHAAAASLPAHVFAPYFETYNGDNPVTLSKASGAKYLTFAFLQTASSGSCTAYWDGDTSQPISSSGYRSNIAAIQAAGGNVIPSFGGYTADTTGTDIADSCTSVSSIAKVYENVITTYNVSRWAKSNGINTVSFWALQRDNGGCPGTAGSDTCSGISQSTWYFSHTFEPFTG